MTYTKRNETRGDKLKAELVKRNQSTRYLTHEVEELAEQFGLNITYAWKIVRQHEKEVACSRNAD